MTYPDRRTFLTWLATIPAYSFLPFSEMEENNIEGLIKKAGNTPIETERYRLLQQLVKSRG